jgi:hypothetical protein
MPHSKQEQTPPSSSYRGRKEQTHLYLLTTLAPHQPEAVMANDPMIEHTQPLARVLDPLHEASRKIQLARAAIAQFPDAQRVREKQGAPGPSRVAHAP